MNMKFLISCIERQKVLWCLFWKMNDLLDNVGGTKFASCFICNEQGHLSKNCPKNTHGIYPKVCFVHFVNLDFFL